MTLIVLFCLINSPKLKVIQFTITEKQRKDRSDEMIIKMIADEFSITGIIN